MTGEPSSRKVIVLPTRVGMVRPQDIAKAKAQRAPHPRGDGPETGICCLFRDGCSPPAWGWSAQRRARTAHGPVLPTRVGMVRSTCREWREEQGAPHPRGDGPYSIARVQRLFRCSPPAWGWSGLKARKARASGVLPTRVGMVRNSARSDSNAAGAPHPRGDGPACARLQSGSIPCSPPAWGWSAQNCRRHHPSPVLPTRVGMVRTLALGSLSRTRAPHPRGDGPNVAAGIGVGV